MNKFTSKFRRSSGTDGNKSKFKKIRNVIIGLVVASVLLGGGFVTKAIVTSPKIDPGNILNEMSLNSVIVDKSGKVLEQLRSEENRTIVQLNEIPDDLQNAFVSIEDQRFRNHSGLDFRGIAGAVVANMRAGHVVRGASTLTQQLARNAYLTNEVKFDRKIKEAFLAKKLEKNLSKDQILEAYLNSIYLGEGAYGVQEAASTYFDKNVSELNLAESAVIAGITNNPVNLTPYYLNKPEDIDPNAKILGEKTVLGEKYKAVFNPNCIERQRIILDKMVELGYINDSQAEEARNYDIEAAIVVKEKEVKDISSYFSDYLKQSVIDDLVNEHGFSTEDANRKLYTGGLKIYASMDSELQEQIEDIYNNLNNYVNMSSLSSWVNDDEGNITTGGEKPGIVYYAKNNILTEDGSVKLDEEEFETAADGSITIDSSKINVFSGALDFTDYFTIDGSGNLTTHELGRISLNPESYTVKENGDIVFNKEFLDSTPNFLKEEDGSLLISDEFFTNDETGVIQPQSATVIIDQSNGEIKAMVGGRSNTDEKVTNRASMPRQTGSVMKPLGAYLPALDNGYTAATPIDDVPFINEKGQVWPNNYDFRSRGLVSLRESVEQSINTNAVKVVNDIGINTSMDYLRKMGIITDDDTDSFVTKEENNEYNDENLSALALGGLTHGVSPVKMAGAYAAIANSGTYLKPTAYTKIEDHNGDIVIDNEKERVEVVSPETAYVMTDILHSTVSDGLDIAKKARIYSNNETIPVAGKTGTTDQNADVWFAGYTPYYTAAVWVGNDSMSVKLSRDSGLASEIWSTVMSKAHEGLQAKSFEEPEDMVHATVCTLSGKLASKNCGLDTRGVVKEEIFAKGTEPQDYCEQHVYLRVHRRTNNLASADCPNYLTYSKLFFRREPAYDPSKHNNVYPEDYEYEAPTAVTYCN